MDQFLRHRCKWSSVTVKIYEGSVNKPELALWGFKLRVDLSQIFDFSREQLVEFLQNQSDGYISHFLKIKNLFDRADGALEQRK